MPIISPILRLVLLFLNIYETYKTLKPPALSSRGTGRPSTKALSQRKRDLKGCLAVWIVWCCIETYDRTLDGIVRILVPFYDELKSLVLLFFILTRARGAEPIYLHIIRPLVKPYAATLDYLHDMTHEIGDFLFLMIALPIRFVLSWWGPESDETDSQYTATPSSQTPGDVSDREAHPSRRPSEHSRRSSHDTSIRRQALERKGSSSQSTIKNHSSLLKRGPSTRSAQPNPPTRGGSSSRAPPRQPAQPQPQIWHPPPRREPTPVTPTVAPPSPHTFPPAPGFPTQDQIDAEEWRKYPTFPSAYPITPTHQHPRSSAQITPPQTPPNIVAPSPRRPSEIIRPEVISDFLASESGSIVRSGSYGGNEGDQEDGSDESEDEDDGHEEDAFNFSLRTPKKKAMDTRRDESPESASGSSSDVSTRLTTVGNGTSSMRTSPGSSGSTRLTTTVGNGSTRATSLGHSSDSEESDSSSSSSVRATPPIGTIRGAPAALLKTLAASGKQLDSESDSSDLSDSDSSSRPQSQQQQPTRQRVAAPAPKPARGRGGAASTIRGRATEPTVTRSLEASGISRQPSGEAPVTRSSARAAAGGAAGANNGTTAAPKMVRRVVTAPAPGSASASLEAGTVRGRGGAARRASDRTTQR